VPVLAQSDFLLNAPGEAIETDEFTLGISETSLDIITPESIASWTLQPQASPNVRKTTMTIKSTEYWTVSVFPDSTTGGYPSEYDSANLKYVWNGMKLSSPMIIIAQEGNTVDLSQGGVLIQGQGNKIVPITFEQIVTWNDPILTEGHFYQIRLIFSIAAG
jgi:hypothetical protein